MDNVKIGLEARYNRYYAFPVLSYVRSGYMNPSNSSLLHSGSSADNWSNLSSSDSKMAFFLGMGGQYVTPYNSYERFDAFAGLVFN